MIAQKHPGNADFTRGFCRHGPVCFEDENTQRLRRLAPHKSGRASMTALKITPRRRHSGSDAAKPQLLKAEASRLNLHRPR